MYVYSEISELYILFFSKKTFITDNNGDIERNINIRIILVRIFIFSLYFSLYLKFV